MSLAGRAKTVLETGSTLLVIAAASAFLWTTFWKPATAVAPVRPAPIQDTTGIITSEYLTNGAGEGDIAVVEFSDFQCPFCARHAIETLPALKSKTRYFVLHLPFGNHPEAMPAAKAAECAAQQGRFWEMHQLLFANQKDLSATQYGAHARSLMLDEPKFSSCMLSHETLKRIEGHIEVAKTLKITGTPTMFVGRVRPDGGVDLVRRITGAHPAETFLAELRDLSE